MSIYLKLAQARVRLQEKGLNKTGNNRSFKYFELKDFLPEVNKIFSELKMCAVVSYDHEFATLTIYDGEKDDKIVFTSPMVQKALPNGTEIQNLGAIQTYQRRYLYLTALEIAESDAVDCLDTSNEKPYANSKQQPPKPKSQPPSSNSTQQAMNSTPVKKSNEEKFKARFATCQTKEELSAMYDKLYDWVQENHPEQQSDLDLVYNDTLMNLM